MCVDTLVHNTGKFRQSKNKVHYKSDQVGYDKTIEQPYGCPKFDSVLLVVAFEVDEPRTAIRAMWVNFRQALRIFMHFFGLITKT